MKNKLRKKAIAMLFITVVTTAMTGCDTNGKDGRMSSKMKDEIYAENLLMMEGIQGEPVVYIVQDSKVYVETRDEDENVVDEPSEEKFIRLYSMNPDGEHVKELDYKLAEEFDNFLIGQDGSLIYTKNREDEGDSNNMQELVKKGADGEEIQRIEISCGEDRELFGINNGLKADFNGHILVLGDNKLLVYDENLQVIGEIPGEADCLTGIAITKDGQVVCSEQSCEDGKAVERAHMLNLEEKQWGDVYLLEGESSSSERISVLDGYGEYDFYYRDGDGIYGYDQRKKGKKVMDFMASDIRIEYQNEMIPVGDGRYIGKVSTYQSNMGNTGLAIYSKVDPAMVPDKKIITFGGICISEAIKQEVEAFNKENKEYKIEFREYINSEDPYTKMTADIIAGNAPDIIDLSNESIAPYAAKGVLEDLTPYFDYDPELGKEDVIPAVWDAMEIDGKHYFLASGFFLRSLIGKSKDVGTNGGWTYEELEDVLEKKGKGIQILDVKKQVHLLQLFMETSENDFIDWNTGTCSFDGDEFRNILELCNEYAQQPKDESDVELFTQGKQLLLETGVLNIDEFIRWDEIFGDEICYIGYPNKERQGNYYSFINKIAICANSKVKDGAWEFIRTIMTKEYQGTPRYVNDGEIPTRQDCFDLEIEAAMTTREYTNEMGQDIMPRCAQNGEIQPMTEEQEKKFRKLIDNTRRCEQYDEEIISIIGEEVSPYFAGDKSLEETVKLVQNRVKTYVNEGR